MTDRKSFTLMELMIIIGIIAIVATGLLAIINPFAQIGKSQDARRKSDMDIFRKAMENYYNDHGCYPQINQICYDSDKPLYVCESAHSKLESIGCHICGRENNSPSLKPYLDPLICDPQHPTNKYLYIVEGDISSTCTSGRTIDCPQWYNLYSKLYNTPEKQIKGYYGAVNGLVVDPANYVYPYGHDYYVGSGKPPSYSKALYCINRGGLCNNCGETYSICEARPACQKGKYYSSITMCHDAGGR